MRRGAAVLILQLLLAATTAEAEVLWRSGATVDGWDTAQSAAGPFESWSRDRIATVPSPVPGASPEVLRITLKAGDRAYNARRFPPAPLGNRSEVVREERLGEGDERWYGWSVLFPAGFVVNDPKGGGAVFAQWHHVSEAGESGSPPILFTANARELRLVTVPHLDSQEAITLARTPQRPDQWREMIVHLVFSSDPVRGEIEWWCDGARIFSKHVATLFPGYQAYLKMGLYRRPTTTGDNVIYIGEVTEGTQRADVWP